MVKMISTVIFFQRVIQSRLLPPLSAYLMWLPAHVLISQEASCSIGSRGAFLTGTWLLCHSHLLCVLLCLMSC